jgi:ubiquitin carboxyl-terminal hydrolase 2/21
MNKDDTLICAYLYQVCKDMVDTVNTQQPYIDITNFKTVFGNKHPNFDGYLQNDSQEFCRVLLEDISNELNEIKNKVPYSQLTNSDRISKRQRDIQFDKNFKDREKSIITELFYSQVITTFKCQCKAEIYSFQKLLDFPLLLPVNKPKIDIKDLLKIYFKKEIIEFERPCEKCKKIEKHIKEIKISRPPEILILSLQRSDPITQKKNECIVTFPEILDITEFLDHECGHDSEPLYSLFAVINHSGSIDFGHYYSYIKFRNKGEWYLFNDSSVKKFGNTNPNFQQAYALFYIKKYINN